MAVIFLLFSLKANFCEILFGEVKNLFSIKLGALLILTKNPKTQTGRFSVFKYFSNNRMFGAISVHITNISWSGSKGFPTFYFAALFSISTSLVS